MFTVKIRPWRRVGGVSECLCYVNMRILQFEISGDSAKFFFFVHTGHLRTIG